MNSLTYRLSAVVVAAAGIFACISCDSEEAKPSSAMTGRTISVEPGVAGGTIEDTFTASVTVSAVDKSSRKVTLTATDGRTASFTAGPEIRNFDQLHAGDKLTATISEKLVVYVRRDGAAPSASEAAGIAMAPLGAKPGVIVAEAFQLVATVKSMDTVNRTADLLFSDGQIRTVKVRPDVDMSKYKTGDSVIIQVTESLALLVAKP